MGNLHGGGRTMEECRVDESTSTASNDQFKSFKIPRLTTEETSIRSRIEVILTAWSIVLYRTQEGGHLSCEWAIQITNFKRDPIIHSLNIAQILQNTQVEIREVIASVSRHIESASLDVQSTTSVNSSILLSTSLLSRISTQAKNEEETLHLEVQFKNESLQIRPIWRTNGILPFTITRYVETLAEIANQCISNSNTSVVKSTNPTSWDLDEIWRWNGELPPTHDFCMHDVISEQARRLQDKVAISSWDGDLSYAQIERHSTYMARSMQALGVQLHDFVPVFFEKSRWTIVAVLAVMKAGATLVMMDPTLPLARLQNMAKQVNATIMLTSRLQHDLSTSIMPQGKHLVVEEDSFIDFANEASLPKLPAVPTSALMYIIFTSGSTGTPKGVKISHQTYTSSAFPRAKAVGYTENSRVLDFASYAFDVSIDSMLLTLGNGGCLCIPSDEDRLNDINGVIRNMRINYAGVTPSVARILDSDVIKSLTGGLGLGGEAASASDVTRWGESARIVIGYGPCECTIGCTINSSAATGRGYVSIGHGNGAAIWIVDPANHELLLPVGAVGELLVEGPIVGQGYVNDPDKTAAAFIENPSWLSIGHRAHQGRTGRLYKTGDLGKYDPDGTGGIVFAGRKDTQVKLRGQRVELGEIESQLSTRLPADTNVIVEVIKPQNSGSQSTLVAFLAFEATKNREPSELQQVELGEDIRKAITEANAELENVLPRYMIPTAYIPVNTILVLISGKTDRKRLREFGATVDLRELDKPTLEKPSRELSDRELRLREAWAQVLKLDDNSIRPDDNFFALGGDSLAAMKLVSVCRTLGLDVSVTNTFGNPTLSAMAGEAGIYETDIQVDVSPFSMISGAVEAICADAASACGKCQADIEDIYPCTPTQESLFTFSLKSVIPYVAQRVAVIPSDISIDMWKSAWEEVVASQSILRSRVAQLQEPGLQQVVIREKISWMYASGLAQYLEADRIERMDLGQSLARYAIVHDSTDGKHYMVWTVHHVLYDGWSEPLILDMISKTLQRRRFSSPASMKHFVRYVHDTDQEAMRAFWNSELKGAVGPQFPRLPSRDYFPTPNGILERKISFQLATGSPFTLATLIRGAWALVASLHTGSDDIVFGETLTGRDIPMPGIEGIIGPLVATVPMRVHISRAKSIESYLQAVQQGMLARVTYQHMGMQNIRKVSQDAQIACETGTGIVIQPESEYLGSDLGFASGDVAKEALHFNPYPLMLAFGVGKDGFRVCASFDKGLVEVAQMERILAQLETACVELSSHLSRKLGEIVCLPEAELNQIWRGNKDPPMVFDDLSHQLKAPSSIKEGWTYPRAMVPWVCDPRNLSQLTPIGCVGELCLEGAFLPGKLVDSPPWLTAGSSSYPGRKGGVRSTGDLVQLREDGRIAFVRHRGTTAVVQGQTIDFAELDSYLSDHLPPSARAVAAVRKTASGEESLVVVAQNQCGGDRVKILGEEHRLDPIESSISADVLLDLAVALGKFDKSVRSSLASYLVPLAYVVVDSIPSVPNQVDLLNQLVSSIPEQVLQQSQQSLRITWSSNSAEPSLTDNERTLRSSWARILCIEPLQIEPEDNFFRLGGDSVHAMKLSSDLRSAGYTLTVADIFQHMRLRDAAKRLKINKTRGSEVEAYRPFSNLRIRDVQHFLYETVRSQLQDPSWGIEDVAPVTHTQAKDIEATIYPPQTAIQYTILHLDRCIPIGVLTTAVHALVQTHPILRTVFIRAPQGYLQVVLSSPPLTLNTQTPSCSLEDAIDPFCNEDIASAFPLGSLWTVFTLLHYPAQSQTLILRLSHAQYDGISLSQLLSDLSTLCAGGSVSTPEPFTSYIAATLSPSLSAPATQYWKILLPPSSSPSPPPIAPGSIFRSAPLLLPHSLPDGITPATLLTASWALLLARLIPETPPVFALVTSGRAGLPPALSAVVGPAYQLTPVRITTPRAGLALLHDVQAQVAASAAHDFLGWDRIAEAVGWEEEMGYGSVVHFQDVDEEAEEMEFGGGRARVDIRNPGGEEGGTVKVVAYRRGGRMMVGIVGGGNEEVEGLVEELRGVVEELAACAGGVVEG